MDRYNSNLVTRLNAADERNLQDIIDAIIVDKSEAVRFALEVTKILIQFTISKDPHAVLVEQSYSRPKKTFIESMSHEELADAMIFVREKYGSSRFDKLLQDAKEYKELEARNDQWFNDLLTFLRTKEGPFDYDYLTGTLVLISEDLRGNGISQSYAGLILDNHIRKGDLVKGGIDKYEVKKEEQQPALVSKEEVSTA